jgi:hypothetical protein
MIIYLVVNASTGRTVRAFRAKYDAFGWINGTHVSHKYEINKIPLK